MATQTKSPIRALRVRAAILGALLIVAGIIAFIPVPVSRGEHKTIAAMVLPPAIPAPQKLFGKSFVRVLLVGLDYDYDPSDQETSAHARSDIIMAIGLDFHALRIFELSVPRDMVTILPDGTQAKINQAQSQGGIAESEVVVSQWLDIPGFDRYVTLRIDTTKDLIDAIGGIDLTVQNSDALRHQGPNGPIDYDDSWGHLHVHFKPGFQHLDGAQAVGYARFRHDWCSDPCRILRQQQVIRAIVTRLKDDKLNTALHIGALASVLHKDVETNLTPEEEVSIAYAFRDVPLSAVRTAQVPYIGTVDLPGYGDSIVADDAAKADLVRTMLLDPADAAASSHP
jgi:LCP family protein required for cell wall assembly